MCDVLVVDDQEVVRMVLVAMLEDEGLSVREAASPAEALAAAQEQPGCSVLVTDIDLGVAGLDGFAVAAKVRRLHPGTPVVFVSGQPQHFNGRRRSPDERTLGKPFSKEALVGAVRSLLPH